MKAGVPVRCSPHWLSEVAATVMKKLILSGTVAATLCCSAAVSAAAESSGVKVERNVPVRMRDGIVLRADVHRPDRGGPYPVLVRRTPYDKDGSFNKVCARQGTSSSVRMLVARVNPMEDSS